MKVYLIYVEEREESWDLYDSRSRWNDSQAFLSYEAAHKHMEELKEKSPQFDYRVQVFDLNP